MKTKTISPLVIRLVIALSLVLTGCVVVTPTPAPTDELEEPDAASAIREAEREVPVGRPLPAPSPTPTPVPKSPPTRIVAPAIDLDSEIVPVGWKLVTRNGKRVSEWEVADSAAGWHQNSALPGEGGNIVISGHHNLKGEVFRYIVDLIPGDVITLYSDGQPLDYSVKFRLVVHDKGVSAEQRRENTRWIGSFPEERLTLVSCWPYTSNTHRVIVVAAPVSGIEVVDEDTVDRELDKEAVASRGPGTESENAKHE